MDVNSIKVGTIGRFHIRQRISWNPDTGEEKVNEYDVCGVVIAHRKDYHDFFVVNELGVQKSFKEESLVSVSSARIGKEIRAQFSLIAKKYEEIQKLEDQRKNIEKILYDTRNVVKKEQEKLTHLAGRYSAKEFDNMVYKYDFRVSASRSEGKSVYVMLQQSDRGTRYSKPDVSREFPFVYQEYDGCCFLREEHAPKAYKDYLNRNAPKIIPALAKLAEKTEQTAEVGDKYIYATTNYWIKLKNGYIKEDVDAIIDIIKG